MYKRNYRREKQIKDLFSTKVGGKLYKMFYEGKSFRQKKDGEVLLTKYQVIERLGLDYYGKDNIYCMQIDRYWNQAIANLRHSAWDRMQPWGTIFIRNKDGSKVWLHGYSMDPSKQEAMQSLKHIQSVHTYLSEKKQERAFQKSSGQEVEDQIEFNPTFEYSFNLNQ